MIVRDQIVDIDIIEELKKYDWEKATVTSDKFIACSPWRNETNPSFFVRLEDYGTVPAGMWKDSGAGSTKKSGTFPMLIAHLKHITLEEAEEYLLATYKEPEGYYQELKLKIPTLIKKEYKHYPNESLLQQFQHHHDYLIKRGISPEVIEQMEIGYSPEKKCITIPWRDTNNRLANIKYRSVFSKVFWYEKGAIPISELIFNLNRTYENQSKRILVCEAEIDAMTSQPFIDSVALGGSNFSDKKCELLIKSPASEIYLAFDNDEVGKKTKELLAGKLKYYKKIKIVTLPKEFKDLNEVKDIVLLEKIIENAENFSGKLVNLPKFIV